MLNSTQSRDCKEDYINLPVTDALIVDTYRTVQPQIILFEQNSFDKFDCVATYIVDIIYAAQNLHNPPVTVSTLQASDTPIVCRDQQLQRVFEWRRALLQLHSLIRTYHFSNHPLFTI